MNPFFKIAARVSPIFRRKRMQAFMRTVQPQAGSRILDVGGLPRFWTDPVAAHITILNLSPLEDYEAAHLTPNMTTTVGDGTCLPYDDEEFDIVFSNSVIEHLGSAENQAQFAREVQRVGQTYWVQTPAKEFPIEPHYYAPFVHWLPKDIQRRLLRNFTLWGLMGRPEPEVVEEALAELRLLGGREFHSLFPGSQLWTERVLGLPKSYVTYSLKAQNGSEAVTDSGGGRILDRMKARGDPRLDHSGLRK